MVDSHSLGIDIAAVGRGAHVGMRFVHQTVDCPWRFLYEQEGMPRST